MISIHAPARGATRCNASAPMAGDVSIHAPARGATLLKYGSAVESLLDFNPRSRAGSDIRSNTIASSRTSSFNPRSRAGSDPARDDADRDATIKFQSTLPRGERHARVGRRCAMFAGFNPRSRAGSDARSRRVIVRARRLFQSTLPRGERPRQVATADRRNAVSIHAPARGATAMPRRCDRRTACFNPRSRAGSDCTSTAADGRR